MQRDTSIIKNLPNIYVNGLPQFPIKHAPIGNILYFLPNERFSILLFAPAPAIILLILLPSVHKIPVSGDLRLSIACLLPFSMLFFRYCWGHDYDVGFASAFLAASLFRESFIGKKNLLTALPIGRTACDLHSV